MILKLQDWIEALGQKRRPLRSSKSVSGAVILGKNERRGEEERQRQA